jgi:hypothetical protein
MENDKKLKKLLIEVEEELFFKFKTKVVSNRKTIKSVLTELIKQYAKEK